MNEISVKKSQMTAVCALGYKQAAALRAADQAHTLPLQQTMANLKRGGRAFALTRLQAARLFALASFQVLPFVFALRRSVYSFCVRQYARRNFAKLFAVSIYLEIVEQNVFFIIVFMQPRHDVVIINVRFYKRAHSS